MFALYLVVSAMREKEGDRVDDVELSANSVTVTKPFSRDYDLRGDLTGKTEHPREAFEAARKRGMTAREVKWVVEDFEAMTLSTKDLGSAPEHEYYEIRKRGQQWYLDTLVSGFGLSGGQKSRAAERLRKLGEKGFEDFQKSIAGNKPFEIDGKAFRVVGAWNIRKLTDAGNWLSGEGHAPWNLCELDEAQAGMVGFKDGEGQWEWLKEGSTTLDYGSEDRYTDLTSPSSEYGAFMSSAGRVFPLSMEQVDRIRNNPVVPSPHDVSFNGSKSLLILAENLAPSQLKTLLLINPGMAGQLLEELER